MNDLAIKIGEDLLIIQNDKIVGVGQCRLFGLCLPP